MKSKNSKLNKRQGRRKKFLPLFAPSYAEVIAESADGFMEKLQIIRPIQYTGNSIRVFVRKP